MPRKSPSPKQAASMKLATVIQSDPEILAGTPVFVGTRGDSTPLIGWAGLKNGALLAEAE